MLATLHIRGAREAASLLAEIAERAADASPAWSDVADDVFEFERRWWAATYGARTDTSIRPRRNPRFMFETGGLRDSATIRGAQRQTLKIEPSYLLLEVTHGLAGIHERRGREVLGEPSAREARHYAAKVADYILTGDHHG